MIKGILNNARQDQFLVNISRGLRRRHDLTVGVHGERVPQNQKHINFQHLGHHEPTSRRRRCKIASYKGYVLSSTELQGHC